MSPRDSTGGAAPCGRGAKPCCLEGSPGSSKRGSRLGEKQILHFRRFSKLYDAPADSWRLFFSGLWKSQGSFVGLRGTLLGSFSYLLRNLVCIFCVIFVFGVPIFLFGRPPWAPSLPQQPGALGFTSIHWPTCFACVDPFELGSFDGSTLRSAAGDRRPLESTDPEGPASRSLGGAQ